MDIDKLDPATGNSVAIYSQKSLAECKILCESAGSCYSIHYHPFQNSAFNGCQLKYRIFTDQSQITNHDGTWTSYWLFDCSSGNLCCYYFFDIHIEEALKSSFYEYAFDLSKYIILTATTTTAATETTTVVEEIGNILCSGGHYLLKYNT